MYSYIVIHFKCICFPAWGNLSWHFNLHSQLSCHWNASSITSRFIRLDTTLTRKTAGTAENPAANKHPHKTSKLYTVVTLHTFTTHRTVIDPLALLFRQIDIILLSHIIRPKFWTPQFLPLPQSNFSQNRIISSLGRREGSYKNWTWLVK